MMRTQPLKPVDDALSKTFIDLLNKFDIPKVIQELQQEPDHNDQKASID